MANNVNLPLVSLSLLQPFISELERLHVDPSEVLATVGLTLDAVHDSDLVVHAMVVHQFLENAAIATDDEYLGANVGAKLDTSGWPLLTKAAKGSQTIGDFLSKFISEANTVASSAIEYLHIEGENARLGETRSFTPSIAPAQNDAFMVGLMLSIVRRALADDFDPSQVMIKIADPSVLPEEYSLMQLIKGNRDGFQIQFPSKWLSNDFEWELFQKKEESERAGLQHQFNIVTAFQQVLKTHVGRGRISAIEAANLVDMDRHKLGRLLSARNTTISDEIEKAQLEFAQRQLLNTNQKIGEIALNLGYQDASNFTKSFRRQTGLSPREFRQKNQN